MRNLTEKQYRDRIRIANLNLLEEIEKDIDRSPRYTMTNGGAFYGIELVEYISIKYHLNKKRKQLALDKKL